MLQSIISSRRLYVDLKYFCKQLWFIVMHSKGRYVDVPPVKPVTLARRAPYSRAETINYAKSHSTEKFIYFDRWFIIELTITFPSSSRSNARICRFTLFYVTVHWISFGFLLPSKCLDKTSNLKTTLKTILWHLIAQKIMTYENTCILHLLITGAS